MRRNRQELSAQECPAILRRGTSGVLAVHGDDDYPYAVPVSYCYVQHIDSGACNCADAANQGAIYIHGALSGHRLDAIKGDQKISFCVVDEDHIVPEKYTTFFRSVIVFGRAHMVEDVDERRQALEMIGNKYSPGDEEGVRGEADSTFARTSIVRIDIEHLSGKEAIEFVRARAHEKEISPES